MITSPRPRALVAALAAAGVALAALTGCTTAAGEPPGSSSAAPRASDPQLHRFDAVNAATIARGGDPTGPDFIDGLVRAGYDKGSMQLTADKTTIGLDADSVQFAVAAPHRRCLIGQYGRAVGGYHGRDEPMLAGGGCLVGQTRPINW